MDSAIKKSIWSEEKQEWVNAEMSDSWVQKLKNKLRKPPPVVTEKDFVLEEDFYKPSLVSTPADTRPLSYGPGKSHITRKDFLTSASVPNPNDINKTLEKVFPGGSISVRSTGIPVTEYFVTEFQVMGHRFLIKPESGYFGEGDGAMYYKSLWMPPETWATSEEREIYPTPETEDSYESCIIRTWDDLIGWVSFARTEVEERAVQAILQNIGPQGIRTLDYDLNIAWNTLKACGLKPDSEEFLLRLTKSANFPWVCTRGPVAEFDASADSQTILRFQISIEDLEICAGLYPFEGEPYMMYSYKIPFQGDTSQTGIYERGDKLILSESGTLSMSENCSKEDCINKLNFMYMEIVCNHIRKELEGLDP